MIPQDFREEEVEVENSISRNWDESSADVKNVMRSEYPEYVNSTRKCLRQMGKNRIEHDDTDTIKRYAKKYKLNEEKILLMYSN